MSYTPSYEKGGRDSGDLSEDSHSRLMQHDYNNSQSGFSLPVESKYRSRRRAKLGTILLWIIALMALSFAIIGLINRPSSSIDWRSAILEQQKVPKYPSPSSSAAGLISSWKSSSKEKPNVVEQDEEILESEETKSLEKIIKEGSGEEDLPCPVGIYDDVLVVLKTGASVAFDRALIHLHTTLRCIPHKLFIADVDMKVEKTQFIDVIKDLDSKLLSHSQLEYYHLQKKVQEQNEDLIEFSKKVKGKLWDLDKFKFIPMIAKAWNSRKPQTNWFVFLEADTLVDFANLQIMLKAKDSNKPWFLGSPSFINGVIFAHGGSGFILSKEAMKTTVGRSPEDWLLKHGPKALDNCCGDYLLSQVLLDEGVKLTSAVPLVQGDLITQAPIIPEYWCRPVVTMHHVKTIDLHNYWSLAEPVMNEVYQGTLNHSLTWNDMFKTFVEPRLERYKLEWDNISLDWEYTWSKHRDGSDEEKKAFKTPAGCEEKCRQENECRQWNHRPNVCKMARSVRYGQIPEKGFENMISGWMLERIDSFKADHDICENGANFKLQGDDDK